MKKIWLVFLLFFCGFGLYSQNIKTVLNKVAHHYYQDSIVSVSKWYSNKKTYFKTGELLERIYYKNGRCHGASYKYNKKREEVATWLLKKAKQLGYEKTHDRYDLQAYLEFSCAHAEIVEKQAVVKRNKVEETAFADKPFVYSNLGKDIIRVENFPVENFDHENYDYSSRLVSKNKAVKNAINISNLPKGVYLLKVYKTT